MTALDLRALGWVVTRDLFWDVARSLAGGTRRIPLAAMEGLTLRWRALRGAVAKTSDPLLTRFAPSPLSRSMPTERLAAAAEYLTFLSTSCPELYSLHVVEERCRRAGAQAIAGAFGSMVFGYLAGPAHPLTADIAVVLFVMGAWHLITFSQLRRVRKLIAHLARRSSYRGAPGLLP